MRKNVFYNIKPAIGFKSRFAVENQYLIALKTLLLYYKQFLISIFNEKSIIIQKCNSFRAL